MRQIQDICQLPLPKLVIATQNIYLSATIPVIYCITLSEFTFIIK